MDSFLDWIASLRGRDRKVERDAKKNATLAARSSEAPVIAQRPIAPLQPIQSEEKRHVPMEMVSVTDTGAESVIIDEETNEVSAPVNRGLSIEEMAYGTSSRRATSTQARSGFAPQPTCRVCSAPNPVERDFVPTVEAIFSAVLNNPTTPRAITEVLSCLIREIIMRS